jgi:hypothetical protein
VGCFNEALTAEGLEPCFTALTRQERGLSARLDQAQHDPAKVAEDARRAGQMIPKIANIASRLEKAIIVAAQLQQLNVQNRIGICAARVTRKTREKLAWTFPKRVLLEQHGFDRRIERARSRILAQAEAAVRCSSEMQRQLDASRVMHRLQTAAANTRARAVEALRVAATASHNLMAEKGATTVEQAVQRVVRETETALVAASSLREKIVGPHPHSMRQQTRRAIAETTSKAHEALLLRQHLGHRVAAIGFGSRIQSLRAKLSRQVATDLLQLTKQRAQLATLNADRRLIAAESRFERVRTAAFDQMAAAGERLDQLKTRSDDLERALSAETIQRAAERARRMLLIRLQMLGTMFDSVRDADERRQQVARMVQTALNVQRDREAKPGPVAPSRMGTLIAMGAAAMSKFASAVSGRPANDEHKAPASAPSTIGELVSQLADGGHSERQRLQREITDRLGAIFARNPTLTVVPIADWPALCRDEADRDQINAVLAVISADVDVHMRFHRSLNEARMYDAGRLRGPQGAPKNADGARQPAGHRPPAMDEGHQAAQERQRAKQHELDKPTNEIGKAASGDKNAAVDRDTRDLDRGMEPNAIPRRHRAAGSERD